MIPCSFFLRYCDALEGGNVGPKWRPEFLPSGKHVDNPQISRITQNRATTRYKGNSKTATAVGNAADRQSGFLFSSA
jgi:hypothetical protein